MEGIVTPAQLLRSLRTRADEDFSAPDAERVAGRHQLDLEEMGVRVALTRARYPNRVDGEDLYVVTVSRLGLRQQPDPGASHEVLAMLFGAAAAAGATERPGGPLIRMFRVPAGGAAPSELE